MEPKNYQILLFISISSLIIFPSTTAVSVPTAAPSPTPFAFPSPEPSALEVPEPSALEAPTPSAEVPTPSQVPSPNYISFPPSLNPPSLSQGVPTPSAEEPTPSQVPSPNYISFPPSSNPPSPSPSASGPPSTNPALRKICQSTDYPDVCISTISPFLTGQTDPEVVVGVSIKAAMEHTKLAVSLAAKLALVPSPLASVYGDCKDSYDDALENFESAKNALATVDVGTMNSMLSAAITDFGDCEDGLSGQKSPLSEFHLSLTQMTSNSLAIVSLIH